MGKLVPSRRGFSERGNIIVNLARKLQMSPILTRKENGVPLSFFHPHREKDYRKSSPIHPSLSNEPVVKNRLRSNLVARKIRALNFPSHYFFLLLLHKTLSTHRQQNTLKSFHQLTNTTYPHLKNPSLSPFFLHHPLPSIHLI